MMQHRFLTCLLVLLLLRCHNIALAQQNTGHVTLANGDRIPANIQAFGQEGIEFGSSLFAEKVQVRPRFLSSFGFYSSSSADAKTKPDEATTDEFLFRLHGDLRLIGKLVALNESQCEIFCSTIGKIVVPADELLEMSKVDPSGQPTTYSVLNWQSLGSDFRPNKQERTQLTVKENERLTLPNRFEGKLNCSLDFQVEQKTEFQIVLADNGRTVASVGVTNGDLVVQAGDDIEFGEFNTLGDFARLSLALTENQFNVLNELGQSVVNLKLRQNKPLEVTIKNEGSLLRIGQIIVGSQPAHIISSELLQEDRIVWNSAGQPRTVHGIEFSEGKLTFPSLGEDEADESLALTDCQRIWFGANRNSGKRSKDLNKKYTCLWISGQKIEFSQLALEAGQLSFETDRFESSGALVGRWPTEVLIPTDVDQVAQAKPSENKQDAQVVDGDHERFRLAISGIPFSGSYYWGDPSNPVRWKFLGFTEPVTLNIEKKIEIRRVSASHHRDKSNSPDRLILKDGSIIPCSIDSANETGIRFESDKVPATHVPLESFRCIFFDSTNLQWKEKLTNETIKRALTLPRFARDTNFNHVLVGKNGDLLRGNLLAIHADEVEFESRFDPLSIPRKNVVGVIEIDTDAIQAVDRVDQVDEEKPEQQNSPPTVVARVDCGDDFIAVGNYVSLDNEAAVLNSPVLGKLKLDGIIIQQIAFNSQFQGASALEQFIDWRLNTAIEPRWLNEAEFAADANELLNQAAPDFEVAMIADTRGLRLSDHAGKVVVISFWESTSKPSVLGIPKYLNVVQKFSPNDLAFIALNQGETASTINKFLDLNEWSALNIAMDYNKEVSALFKVSGIPHLTVIDRDGMIRFIKVGYSSNSADILKEKIQELLEL